MNPESARLVILIATVVGGAVWLISVFAAAKLLQRRYDPYQPEKSDYDVSDTVRVAGNPADLATLITERLVSAPSGFAGAHCKVIESTPERVRFQMGMSVSVGRRGGNQGTSGAEIELRFRDMGETTEIFYGVDLAGARKRTAIIALCINIFGLAAVTILPAALYIYVAPHPDPQVRWQAVQVCQMVHTLWPPFLVLGLYWRSKRVVKDGLEALIANLQYGK